MQGGEQIRVDEVVAATGLVTETRLAKMAGLAFDRGIVIDPHTMQTSIEDIYAIGDCISVAGVPCRFIEPIVRQAGALSHHVLNREHAGYVHSTPLIRLKTKAFPIVIHGVPSAKGTWVLLMIERVRFGLSSASMVESLPASKRVSHSSGLSLECLAARRAANPSPNQTRCVEHER